jgi:hypothetical protein
MAARNLVPPSDEELMRRVMKRVSVTPSGCWEYQGARHVRSGHALFGYTVQGKTTTMFVHRWMYEQQVGPVPEGLVLDHVVCDNPPCVNPAHLEPKPSWDNVQRGDSPTAVNARKTHCVHGHEFTPENTRLQRQSPSSGGTWMRVCKTCARDKARKYAEARRGKK